MSKDKYRTMTMDDIMADMDNMLKVLWEVGVMSRGMGRNSYAVIAKDEDKSVIVECGDRKDIADRIVNLHNGNLEKDESMAHTIVKNISESLVPGHGGHQSMRSFVNGVSSNSNVDHEMYYVMIGMFRRLFEMVDGD